MSRLARNRFVHAHNGNKGHWIYYHSEYHYLPSNLRSIQVANSYFEQSSQFVSINNEVVALLDNHTGHWQYIDRPFTIFNTHVDIVICSTSSVLVTSKPVVKGRVLVFGTKNAFVKSIYSVASITNRFVVYEQSQNSIRAIPKDADNYGRAIPKAIGHWAIPDQIDDSNSFDCSLSPIDDIKIHYPDIHSNELSCQSCCHTFQLNRCNPSFTHDANLSFAFEPENSNSMTRAIPKGHSRNGRAIPKADGHWAIPDQKSKHRISCSFCDTSTKFVEVSRQSLSRQFLVPVPFIFGMFIYRIKMCVGHVIVWYRRRHKFYKIALFGQRCSLALKACNDMAASGMLGRQELKSFKSSLKALRFDYRSFCSPVDEHIRASGEGSARHERRSMYRSCCSAIRHGSNRAFTVLSCPLKKVQGLKPNSGAVTEFSPSGRFYNKLKFTPSPIPSNPTPSPSPLIFGQADCRGIFKVDKTRLITFATLNVEGLYNSFKYSLIKELMISRQIDVLCIQETHGKVHDTFDSNGFRFFFSGSPKEPHAGVGFVVSPRFRFSIKSFKPHSSRIAEITIMSSPRMIKLYSVYAPSMMSTTHTPEEDTQRKDEFWQQLTSIVCSNTVYFPIVAGDLNSRLVGQYNSDKIGNNLFGKEPTTVNPQYTPNCEYLLEFLDTTSLYIPSTFSNLLPSRLITYKEIDCAPGYSSSNPRPGDFSVLDYFLFPEFAKSVNPTVRSFPHVPFPSRHFLLTCQFSTKMLPKIKQPITAQRFLKPEGDEIIAFHHSLDSRLVLPIDSYDLEFYTDGSCPSNTEVSQSNPAGWAFTFRDLNQLENWTDSNGTVITKTEDDRYVGALVGSNNVAELQALLEALDYIIRNDLRQNIIIWTDSDYSLKVALGIYHPVKNFELAHKLQLLFLTAVKTGFNVTISKC